MPILPVGALRPSLGSGSLLLLTGLPNTVLSFIRVVVVGDFSNVLLLRDLHTPFPSTRGLRVGGPRRQRGVPWGLGRRELYFSVLLLLFLG